MISGNDAIKLRMRLIAFLLLPLPFLLGMRLYFVQVVDHDEMFEKAKRKYTSVRVTEGKRGEIYDVAGNLLVGNAPCVDIFADPSIIRSDRERVKLAFLVAKEFGLDYRQTYRRLAPFRPERDQNGELLRHPDGTVRERPVMYSVLVRNVPIDQAAEIRRKAAQNSLRGLGFDETYMRTYPKGRLLANVLGFTSAGGSHAGLERFYDQAMASSAGRERYERDRTGRPLFYGLHEETSSRDGANIFLTIEEPLQAILEEELDAANEKWAPKAIYAAVADPKTGNILAIAQRPTFDPNDRRRITPEAWRNRIVEDGLEPGSVMKPISIGGALDAGVVTPDTEYDCENGTWFYLGKPLRDSGPHGVMTVTDIMKTSSNIGTAKIALQLGDRQVYQAIRRFGFGQPTGLPLAPETLGIMPPVHKWDGLSVTRFPIGYAILVSPVQMLRAYCALANDGKLPKLRLVDRIEDPETGATTVLPVEPPVQVFRRPETCATLVDMMVKVTGEGGTARRAAVPGYEVAGKTGTSRKYVRGQGYTNKYFTSFIGFVPARRAEFVILVIMDEPQGAYYGGTVCAPVFRSIAERALKQHHIRPDAELSAGRLR